MGTVYRATFTKSLPPNVERFTRKGEQFARWTDSRGRKRTARVTTTAAGDRLLIEAGTYTAKYRDAAGIVMKVATGCRDETAARAVLADLERRVELVRAGVVTAAEDAASNHQNTAIAEHIEAFATHQRAKGCHRDRIQADRKRIERVAESLEWRRLGDLNGEALTR